MKKRLSCYAFRYPYLVTRSLRAFIASSGINVSAALHAAGGQIPDTERSGPLFRPSARYLVTVSRRRAAGRAHRRGRTCPSRGRSRGWPRTHPVPPRSSSQHARGARGPVQARNRPLRQGHQGRQHQAGLAARQDHATGPSDPVFHWGCDAYRAASPQTVGCSQVRIRGVANESNKWNHNLAAPSIK